MKKQICEDLKNAFIELRFSHSGENDEQRFDAVKSKMEVIRAQLVEERDVDFEILIYCVDVFFEILKENDKQKILDFSDLVHNMPEICMGKRTIQSFGKEIQYFNQKYGTKYFDAIKKINTLRLSASVCLLLASVERIINLFVDLPLWLDWCSAVLLLASVVLCGVIIRGAIIRIINNK